MSTVFAPKTLLLNFTGKEVHFRHQKTGKIWLELPSLGFAEMIRKVSDSQELAPFNIATMEVIGLPPITTIRSKTRVFYIVPKNVAELLAPWRHDLVYCDPIFDDRFGVLEIGALTIPLILH